MSVADNTNVGGEEPIAGKIRLPVSLRIVVVSSATEMGDSLRNMVETTSGVKIEVINSEIGKVDEAAIAQAKPDVLILDFKLESPTDLERVSGLLQNSASGCCVIATANTSTVQGVRRLMRLGISDFLTQPINHDELLSALQLAARKVRLTRPSGGGKVVTFLHAGGGAGATTLAVNFACAAQEENEDASVCILDFDVQFGQVAINMDLKSSHGVLDVLDTLNRTSTPA